MKISIGTLKTLIGEGVQDSIDAAINAYLAYARSKDGDPEEKRWTARNVKRFYIIKPGKDGRVEFFVRSHGQLSIRVDPDTGIINHVVMDVYGNESREMVLYDPNKKKEKKPAGIKGASFGIMKKWIRPGHYIRYSMVPKVTNMTSDTFSGVIGMSGVWAWPAKDWAVKNGLKGNLDGCEDWEYALLLRPKGKVVNTVKYSDVDLKRDAGRLGVSVAKLDLDNGPSGGLLSLLRASKDPIAAARKLGYCGIDDEKGSLLAPDDDVFDWQAFFFSHQDLEVVEVLSGGPKQR